MAEWSEEQIRQIAKKESGGGDGCLAYVAFFVGLLLILPWVRNLQTRVGTLEVQVQQLQERLNK